MGLFDSVRDLVGDDEERETADGEAEEGAVPTAARRDPSPTAFRNNAIDAVDQWSEHDLDFSLDSLSRLDSLASKHGAAIDVIRDRDGEEAAADRHLAYTVQAGSYLGEVLVRRCDGRWVEDGDTWAVRVAEGAAAFDVDVFEIAAHSFNEDPAFGEVHERLREDEDEDTGDEDTTDDAETDPADPAAETSSLDTGDIAAYAEELAAVWEEYDLDLTPQSLARLDSLAASEWDTEEFADAEAGGDGMASGMFTEHLKQLGSYYGEVLVREHGGRWVSGDDTIAVRVSGDGGAATVARVFEVARDSLTGPPQFAADYNTVTREADVYAPRVAENAAVLPEGEDGAPVDNAGPDVDRVEPAADEHGQQAGEPQADATHDRAPGSGAGVDGQARTADTVDPPGADEPPAEHEGGADGEVTADAPAADGADGADGSGFDVAAAAREVVADDLGEPDGAETTVDRETEADDTETRRTEETRDATARPEGEGTAPQGEPEQGAQESEAAAEMEEEAVSLDLSDESDNAPAAATPATLEDDAAAFAATWPGYDLDVSPESLARLDRLVAEEYPDAADRDSGFRRDRAVEVGGYLAVVLQGVHETVWVDREGADPLLEVEGATGRDRLDPVAAALARFRGEHDLVEVYDGVRERVSR